MIDFPVIYPNLTKLFPDWLDRFYPVIAQFARGDGYPCGNQGVFIPKNRKCWTHPKTGQRLKKPLTYQMYKDAKEKSQRSRTEKGRTALETREQSFRDKAREKVKGWQKNKESSQPDLDKLQKDLDSVKKLVENIAKASPDKVNSPRDNKVKRDYQKLLASQKQMEEAIQSKQKNKPQSEPKQTPNSTGESGKAIAVSTPDKKVEQKYKDIIANSKHPGRTEEELSSALMHGIHDFHKDNYNRYSDAIKSGTVPKGYENHYQEKVDTFKPVIEAEKFINERRQKAIAGEYETESEARVYVLNKMKEKGYKEYEYYDSPDYKKDYEKLKGVIKSREVPPPLSGNVPSKDLRKTLNPGDKLFVKSYASDLIRSGNPSEYRIADGGEVLKVNIKNAKVRSKGTSLNGKPYDVEGVATLGDVTHVIRDGKRYKVDDSDSSPNDLGIPESSKPRARKRAKKSDFNSHQLLAQFGSGSLRRRKSKQSTCCCNSPNPLRRRKSKQTAKLRRGGNRYV